MKTKILLLVLWLVAVADVRAQIFSTNVFFNPATPTGTNDSLIFNAPGSLRLTPLLLQLQNGGQPTTNTLTWRVRLAIGNTNSWLTVTNWNHAVTNPITDILPINLNALPIFIEVEAINTNGVLAGANIIHQ